ncbi:hypothetical protein H0H81_008652 [Sphagnurus paluster]|uniref:Cytosine-purine permease n=1 Tax=Sphagnurus paluster TaxID=117069 RepID=A0A9P7FQ40_9AGAR|nr:hypothetical protein H0H81_008652 [Sphagnurus paluster]
MDPPANFNDKKQLYEEGLLPVNTLPEAELLRVGGPFKRWTQKLLTWGVESRGTQPVPPEQRTDTQYSKIFFIWFSMNTNILSSILCGNSWACCLQSGFARYLLVYFILQFAILHSTGLFYDMGTKTCFFGVILPCVVNLIVMIGFCVLNSIVGGQALASVNGSLSWTVGIVVLEVVSLLVSFCGYKLLNWYERIAWVPVVISFIVALGVGGKHLSSPPPSEPATVSAVFSFASTLAGFVVSKTPFLLDSLFDLSISAGEYSSTPTLGAAVATVASTVPEWKAGYAGENVGGLLEAMLHPAKGLGKFLTVLLSLSVAGNIAATFYSITLNIQVFIPPLILVPRYVFSLVATAIVIPVAIVGSKRFYDTLVNFLGLIGYWASSFAAIILVEHFVFRKGDHKLYNIADWNNPSRLPSGIAALAAGILSFGLIIPSMDQVWFVGPIAKKTGDVAFEVAFGLSAVLYIPLRALEIRVRKSI